MTLPAIRLDLSDIRGYLPEDNDRGQPPESILGNVRGVGLGSGTDALTLSVSVDRPWIGRPNAHIACGRPPCLVSVLPRSPYVSGVTMIALPAFQIPTH